MSDDEQYCFKKVISLSEWDIPQCESSSLLETLHERMCMAHYRYLDMFSSEYLPVSLVKAEYSLGTESLDENSHERSLFSYEANRESGYKFLMIEMEVWIPFEQSMNPLIEVSYLSCEQSDVVVLDEKMMKFTYELKVGTSKRRVDLNDLITNETTSYQMFVFRGNLQFACKKFALKLKSPDTREGILIRKFEVIQENRLDLLQRTCGNSSGIINFSQNQNGIDLCNNHRFYFEPSILSCVTNLQSNLRCTGELIEDIKSHSCVANCDPDQHFYLLTLADSDDSYPVCLDRYLMCHQMLTGCIACDKFSLICFVCEDNYILNRRSKKCDFRSEQDGSFGKSLKRVLADNFCLRPVCLECMNEIYCMKCMSPFILVHGVCKLCGRGSELVTSSTGDTYCRKQIDSTCSNYDESSGKCLGCFLNVPYNGTECVSTCAPNYYMTTIGTIECMYCIKTIPNCLSCSTEMQCTQCEDGYYLLIGSTPLLNPDVTCVSACPAGYYVDKMSFCAPCGNHCDSCEINSTPCLKCADGFEVDLDYQTLNPSRMERCILSNICPANCVSCSSKTFCDKCMTGYALTVDGFCEKCGNYCLTCESSQVCTSCADGTTDTKCAAIECKEGYYLDETYNCVACTTNCQVCWNSESCVVCSQGYVLEKSTCVPCPSNCAVCAEQSSCIACQTGYFYDLSSGQCVAKGCEASYFYDLSDCSPCGGTCLECSEASLCTICNDSISPIKGICLSCTSDQFFIDQNTCQTCPTNCSICVDIVGCVLCDSGFYFDEASQNCIQYSRCGDGDMVNSQFVNEKLTGKTCDDRNRISGDGCSSTCMIEDGYVCEYDSTSSKSTCKLTENPTPTLEANSFNLESKINEDNLNPILVFRFVQVIVLKSLRVRFRELSLSESERDALTDYVRKEMTIQIQDIDPQLYTYSVTLHDDVKGCNVEFTTNSNIVNKQVSISFSNSFKQANNLSNENETTDFPDTRPISESEKKAAEAVAAVGTAASSTFVASVIPVIIFSNFSFLFNALDLFQMIHYLQFTNIRLPYNIKEFLKVMSNFSVPFSVNFIGLLLEENPIEKPDVPQVYDDGEITGVFLENVSDDFSQVIILAFIHLLLFGFVKLTTKSQKNFILKAGKFIDSKLTSSWQWGWYLDKYWEMFLSVVVSSLLQFYGITLNNTQSIINLIALVASIIVVLASPILFFRVIKQNERMLEKKEILEKWGMLYETLKVNDHSKVAPEQIIIPNAKEEMIEEANTIVPGMSGSSINFNPSNQIENNSVALNQAAEIKELNEKWGSQGFGGVAKYFYVALYVRKILFGVLIVSLFAFPLIQLIIIDLLNVIILGYLFWQKPFEKNLHTMKAIFCELMMIVAQSSLKLLINDSETAEESERVQIGWIFVLSCILILIVQMIFVLVNLFVDIHKQIVEWCTKKPQIEETSPELKVSKKELSAQQQLEMTEEQIFHKNVNMMRNSPNVSEYGGSEKGLMNRRLNQIDFERAVSRNIMRPNRLSIKKNRIISSLETTELSSFYQNSLLNSADQTERKLNKILAFQRNHITHSSQS